MTRRFTVAFFMFTAVAFSLAGTALAEAPFTLNNGVYLPAPLVPRLAADGKVLVHGVSLKAVVADPNPAAPRRKIPPPAGLKTAPEAAIASFTITYVPVGGTDLWGETCYAFPEEAKAAFNAAAAIWGNTIASAVPVTIQACWADLGDSTTLGYSGGGSLYKDFSGAPRANTWYAVSLANSLYGSDIEPEYFDMHITYNQNFTWYYGSDGNTPAGEYDLMTVVLHEIAHGLNFSGSMEYAGGIGNWGYPDYVSPPYYPNIYDVFIRNGSGTQLINTDVYPNPSVALGSALTSNNVWFHGGGAIAANSGQRVKMYAPAVWDDGSSYSHFDYDTFNDTSNQLMVYAISDGESIHDPGVIARGLLDDLGWALSGAPPPAKSFPWPMFLPAITSNSGVPSTPTTYWSALSLVYCSSSAATFSLTAGGVTKNSVMPAGGASGGTGTFEGWVTTTPGAKAFSWQLTSSTCGSWSGSFSYTLQDKKNYVFSLGLNDASQPAVYVSIGDGAPGTAANSATVQSVDRSVAVKGSMQLVDQTPLTIPAESFKSAQDILGQGEN